MFADLAFVVLALTCGLAWAVFGLRRSRQEVIRGELAAFWIGADAHGTAATYPVFAVADGDGTRLVMADTPMTRDENLIGREFPLRLDPEAPQRVAIDSAIGGWWLPIILTVALIPVAWLALH